MVTGNESSLILFPTTITLYKKIFDRTDINKDGNFDVLDLGAVLKTYQQKR